MNNVYVSIFILLLYYYLKFINSQLKHAFFIIFLLENCF